MPEPEHYVGYNPPFFGGKQGVLSRQSGERLIKNDIQQLILTSLGERVMRPEWGTVVKRSVFQQGDAELISNVTNSINSALSRYENRVDLDVNVTIDPEKNFLNINLSGTFTNRFNRSFEMEIGLPIIDDE